MLGRAKKRIFRGFVIKDKEDNDKEDKESNLVEVSVHNEGADEDEDKDGRETHFQN